MRPIKTLLLRVMAIVVALSLGLQAQEVKQGGYRTAQLKVTAGGSGWDFDTGNLIQLVLTDAKGNAESSGEYLTVGNDSPMPIKVSSKRVGIQNVEIGPGERRRFKIQGYRRPNSQYSEFNSSVPVGIVYWSGPSPQETQQAVQAKAAKEADAKAGQERKVQEAQRTRDAEEQAKKDEWTRNAQKQQDDQAARARAAAEESRRQWELSQQRAKAQRDGIAALGQMINKTLADKAIREQQERIRTNLKALESGTLIRCDSCGGSGYSECQRCEGEGVEECSLCSGRGEVGFGQFANKCTMCGGGGKSSCSTCEGTGRQECSRCKGSGDIGRNLASISQPNSAVDQTELFPVGKASSTIKQEDLKSLRISGDSVAQLEIAKQYAKKGDRNEEMKWAKLSADGNNIDAIAYLGMMYCMNGNWEEGCKWTELAANRGNYTYIGNLARARLYGYGGVSKQEKVGFKWAKVGFENGNKGIWSDLFACYISGKGTNVDPEAAINLLNSVSWKNPVEKREFANAEYSLGLMYRDGTGGSPNLKNAYIWLNLADIDESPSARFLIDPIRKKISASDLREADLKIREILDLRKANSN